MRKVIFSALVVLLMVAVGGDANAQSGKGKKTTAKAGGGAPKSAAGGKKASGGSKKKGKGAAAGTDASATDAGAGTGATPPPAATTTPAPQPVVDAPQPVDDGADAVETPNVVAENIDSFDYSSVPLDTTKPKDGFYKLQMLKGAKPFPFPENDKNTVKFYKRLWREINTADSENRIFAIPGETLIQFIMDGLKKGKLIAYSDEGFQKKLTYKQVMGKFRDSAIISILDSNGEITGTKSVLQEFNPDSVTKFEIKEDIFYDKVRGRVVTKIIGISPLKKNKTSTGVDIGDTHPFWLNFDQCRRLLAAKEVVDPTRDLYNISFDDIFIQRQFKSTILMESNPAGQRIKDKYPDRQRQILESNRIEREIQRYKRNLWKFNN